MWLLNDAFSLWSALLHLCLKMNDQTENPATVWFYPELRCRGQGSLGEAASHQQRWALLFKLSSWSFPRCHPMDTGRYSWHIIPLSPGAQAQQPGLLHCHQCCFSSGHCKGFSCQICITCHRLSFPISILICSHALSSLENAEQQISALHYRQDPVATSAKLSKSSLVELFGSACSSREAISSNWTKSAWKK